MKKEIFGVLSNILYLIFINEWNEHLRVIIVIINKITKTNLINEITRLNMNSFQIIYTK
jgi:hypothetical protein